MSSSKAEYRQIDSEKGQTRNTLRSYADAVKISADEGRTSGEDSVQEVARSSETLEPYRDDPNEYEVGPPAVASQNLHMSRRRRIILWVSVAVVVTLFSVGLGVGLSRRTHPGDGGVPPEPQENIAYDERLEVSSYHTVMPGSYCAVPFPGLSRSFKCRLC